MYTFSESMSESSDTLIATLSNINTDSGYKFEHLVYPNIYIPNRSIAWGISGLPEDSEQIVKLRKQISDYNDYLDSLEAVDGFLDYFIEHQLCVSKEEIADNFSEDFAAKVFSKPRYIFSTDLKIVNGWLIDGSVTADYKVIITGEEVILPIGRSGYLYATDIAGQKAMWNWVDNGHDFCPDIWELLEERYASDEDCDDCPVTYYFDAYDQFRFEAPEPQLVKIFKKLESLGYIQTYTIRPDDSSPRWLYYAKTDGSIDVALIDTSFWKNRLLLDQIELMLWCDTEELEEKPYFLTDSNNKQFLSAEKGALGGHNRLKIYGRLDCPSAARYIPNGKYVRHRVFFENEDVAIAAGFRPCAKCMPEAYKRWKAGKEQ